MRQLAGRFLAVWFALGVIVPPPSAEGQETYKLRFNHVLGPSEPYHNGFQRWAKRVKERTDGGLTIDVFHSAQLGIEEDIIEQMREGADIGQNTDAARLGKYVPGIAVVNAPYFVASLDNAFALADSPTMIAWQARLAKEFGLKVVCFDWVQGFRHFFTNKPVRMPEDLNGLRIRTPPAPIWQESIRALGAKPISMSFGDVYPGLQQQLIDGAELTYENIRVGKLYEVLKFASETAHLLLINFQVVSNEWFIALPADYQRILVEECRRAGQETSKVIEEASDRAKRVLLKRGMVVVDNVDLKAFQKAGEKAYKALDLSDAAAQVREETGW